MEKKLPQRQVEGKFNPFLHHLTKYVNREVTVRVYEGAKVVVYSGVCESVDYGQKGVIIRNEDGTLFIPRFISVNRKPRVS